jgi:hypothetical protein
LTPPIEGKLERALKIFNKVIDVELPEGYARTVEMREHTANAYIGRGRRRKRKVKG